jgi:lipopolysaccharide transport system ATP-binding protein
VDIEVEYEVLDASAEVFVGLTVYGEAGMPLFFTPSWSARAHPSADRRNGRNRAICKLPGNFLSEGLIKITVELSSRAPAYHAHVVEHDCIAFSVVDSGQEGSVRAGWGGNFPGMIRPALKWMTETCDSA